MHHMGGVKGGKGVVGRLKTELAAHTKHRRESRRDKLLSLVEITHGLFMRVLFIAHSVLD